MRYYSITHTNIDRHLHTDTTTTTTTTHTHTHTERERERERERRGGGRGFDSRPPHCRVAILDNRSHMPSASDVTTVSRYRNLIN